MKSFQVEIGGETKQSLAATLAEIDCALSDEAEQILGSQDFAVEAERHELRLQQITVGSLSKSQEPTVGNVFSYMEENKIPFCPDESALQLAKAMVAAKTWPDERLVIISRPVRDHRDGKDYFLCLSPHRTKGGRTVLGKIARFCANSAFPLKRGDRLLLPG